MRSSILWAISLCFGVHAGAQTLKQEAIDASQAMGERVQQAAEFIDLTLAGNRYTDARNTSQVSVDQLLSLTEGGVWQNSTSFGVNLRLPNVEKHWQARFSTVDEEGADRDLNQRLIGATAPPNNPGAALLFFQNLGRIKTTFQPRLALTNPLQVDYVLKFESELKAELFRVVPTFELYADAQKGTGEYFSLAFFAKLGGPWSFSQQNEEEYYEFGNTFTMRHGVTFDYRLTDTQNIAWATVTTSDNHDFHLDSINLSLSFNHQAIKKLLKYTVSPFLGFAKAYAFKGKAGILLNIEVTI